VTLMCALIVTDDQHGLEVRKICVRPGNRFKSDKAVPNLSAVD
jgi:hypothetical protein